MPKGVELESVDFGDRRRRLPIPVMPKGVEHMPERVIGGEYLGLPIPVMPKGVEHSTATISETLTLPSHSCNAERR